MINFSISGVAKRVSKKTFIVPETAENIERKVHKFPTALVPVANV